MDNDENDIPTTRYKFLEINTKENFLNVIMNNCTLPSFLNKIPVNNNLILFKNLK